MAITAGSRLGPYEILVPLGAGGMGEVFRARDTKLNRDVAIKVLPAGFAQDQERVARFRREAQLLASLNHPNIASVYGLEESEGAIAIVLELVEGEDLAQRLARGAIPVDESIAIAKQIAEGLEAAHEKGIVHRDLKPANVKLNVNGAVKILDFGLAKAYAGDAAAGDSGLTNSPTLSRPMTEIGVILGTAAYMSPEQARGKPVDKRADIWSFGVVLFEMLTGRRLFTGETVSDTLAAVLKNEPDWKLLPSGLSPAVERLLRRCLDRDPKLRLRDIGEARVALGLGEPADAPSRVAGARRGRAFKIGWSIAALMTVLTAVFATLFEKAALRESADAQRAVRLELLPPKGERLATYAYRVFAISPDGSQIAYVVEKGASRELRLRSMGTGESAPIRGTEGAGHPFFSPDGKWIGFFAGEKLKKVAVAGGAPATLCDVFDLWGAAWGDDGWIYFVPKSYSPVYRIPDAGGTPSPVTRIRTQEREQEHRFPEVLPGSKVLLYAVGAGGDWNEAAIVAERLDTGERKVLVKGGTFPRYLPSGHLVYARAGSLYALAFDARSLTVEGSPVEVARNVLAYESFGFAQMDLSRNGTLVTAPPDAVLGAPVLSWVDREGHGEPIRIDCLSSVTGLQLSPDGNRVAIGAGDSISILDLSRLSTTKLTLPGNSGGTAWSRDGQRVLFGYGKDKIRQIFSKAADDSGEPRLEVSSDAEEQPEQMSKDGSKLLSFRVPTDGLAELLVHPMAGSTTRKESILLFKSLYLYGEAVFSPDARWVAYVSEESGLLEVYVRPASGEDRKWQASIGGGRFPIWSPDGKEIFYTCGERFMAAPVSVKGEEFVAGTPKVLFDNHRIFYFDITADGKRFLVAEDPSPGAQTKLDVVLNWSAEVRRKVKEAQTP